MARRRAASAACSPGGRRRRSQEERRQLELIRVLALFDAAWYLRALPRRRALRRRARPALPATPDHGRSGRQAPTSTPPATSTSTPSVLDDGTQPAGPLPAHRRGPTRRAVPASDVMAVPDDARPRDGPTALCRLPAALARLRAALAAGRPRRPRAGLADSSSGAWPTGCPSPATSSRPDRGVRAPLRDGRGPGERRLRRRRLRAGQPRRSRGASTRSSTSSIEGWRDLRAPSLDFDLWWYWCEYLDPRPRTSTRCCTTCSSVAARGSQPVPGPPPDAHRDAPRRPHPPAGMPVRWVRP